MAAETLYDRLGLPRDATPEEIRRAYRETLLRLQANQTANADYKRLVSDLKVAFDVLSEPDKKAEYDQHLPPETPQSYPVQVAVSYSRNALVQISEPQLLYALLELGLPEEAASAARPHLNLCLVVDCSTSMQGLRLDAAKATAIELIRQLQPEDILSIVKFSDRAEIVLPATELLDKRNAEVRVQLLKAGGGTEIFQGLDLGVQEVRQYHNLDRINHIILLTDGYTYGDEKNCYQLADHATTLPIGISALGIGSQWNDSFLDALTAKTGGSSQFITQPEDIRSFLLDNVIKLGQIYANQVTLIFETYPAIELTDAFRISPDSAPLSSASPMVLGAVLRNAALTLLLEFQIKSIPARTSKITLAQGRLCYQIPGNQERTNYIQRIDFQRPVSKDFDRTPPPAHIVQAMSNLTLYRMQEKARTDMARGDISAASRRLQNIATHLLAQGQRDLARSVLNEVAHIQQNQSFSEEGEKRIKYGTRSLLLSKKGETKKP